MRHWKFCNYNINRCHYGANNKTGSFSAGFAPLGCCVCNLLIDAPHQSQHTPCVYVSYIYVIYSAHCCFEQKIGVETLLLCAPRTIHRIIVAGAIYGFVIRLSRITLLFVSFGTRALTHPCLTLATTNSANPLTTTSACTNI